jgi:hypothetical protein
MSHSWCAIIPLLSAFSLPFRLWFILTPLYNILASYMAASSFPDIFLEVLISVASRICSVLEVPCLHYLRQDRPYDWLTSSHYNSNLKYLLCHIISFRQPDSLAPLQTWCLTSDYGVPLLEISTLKYLKHVIYCIILSCISNLLLRGSLHTVILFVLLVKIFMLYSRQLIINWYNNLSKLSSSLFRFLAEAVDVFSIRLVSLLLWAAD